MVKTKKQKLKKVKQTKFGYGIDGKKYKDIMDSNCFAYADIDKRGEAYYIRRGTHGPYNGKFINHLGTFFNKGDEARENPSVGKRLYEYVRVNKVVFDLYVKFLTTRIEAYLSQAERNI